MPPRKRKAHEAPDDLSHNICLHRDYYIRPKDVDTTPIPYLIWQSANTRQDVLSIIKIELAPKDSQHFKDHAQLLDTCGKAEAEPYRIKFVKMEGEEDVKSVFPIIVHTKKRDSVPNLARVEFYDTDGEWKDLADWLGERTETYAPEHVDSETQKSEALRLEQMDQWDKNGMSFDLLALPPEIRDMIYLHALGPVIFPRMGYKPRPLSNTDKLRTNEQLLKFSRGGGGIQVARWSEYDHRYPYLGNGMNTKNEDCLSDYVFGHPTDKKLNRPNTNLLLVSSQVLNEALRAAWESSTLRIRANTKYRAPYDYWNVVPDAQSWDWKGGDEFEVENAYKMSQLYPLTFKLEINPVFRIMRRLQLELTMTAFYELAGVHPVYGDILAPSTSRGDFSFEDLSYSEVLQSVEIRFMHPREHFQYWKGPGGQPSCHKELCEGFFLIGLENMRSLLKSTKVTIGGYVREETLEKWLPIFADENKGIEHDMSKEMSAFARKYSMSGVATCTCSPPCHQNAEIAKRHRMHWLAGHDIHLTYKELSKKDMKKPQPHLTSGENCHNAHWATRRLTAWNKVSKMFSEEQEQFEGL